jgi:hypothetical protein
MDRVGWTGETSSTAVLTIDHVAPAYSDFQVTPAIAKQGTTVTLTFSVSETLGQTPVLSVNGNAATFESFVAPQYTFAMCRKRSGRRSGFVVELSDRAGKDRGGAGGQTLRGG